MSSPTLSPLEDRIVTILREANGEALSLEQLEERLASGKAELLDTFDVREAVWRLISKGLADFTPRRDVKAVSA